MAFADQGKLQRYAPPRHPRKELCRERPQGVELRSRSPLRSKSSNTCNKLLLFQQTSPGTLAASFVDVGCMLGACWVHVGACWVDLELFKTILGSFQTLKDARGRSPHELSISLRIFGEAGCLKRLNFQRITFWQLAYKSNVL